jgi:hypothetical protein
MLSSTARWMTRSLVVLSCLASSTLLAQSTGGRILGRVADPSGAVLANVKVTLINEATGVSQETTTTGSGDFGFPQVAVGVYRLEFDLPGFKKAIQRSVTLDLNQVVTLNLLMQLGEAKETVEVTSEAPLVDTTSTQLGAVMDSRQVSQLPLNARDTYQLLQLQPGVQGVGGSDLFYGSNQSGAVSVNGGRGRSNNFSVNGGDGNDLFVNSPAIQPTPDSIEEFRVLSNTFDAEYGRNSGAVINVVTKSGTNDWHGTVYEFFRNKALDAKGYLDPFTPDNKQNQFGGTFGGPIKKDKTFFFASYEGRRVVQGITGDPVIVPTAAERTGDFSQSPFTGSITTDAQASILNARCNAGASVGTTYSTIFPGSKIPTNCLDPVAADLVSRFVPCPLADPTCTNPTNTLNNFQSIPDERSHANQFTFKLDHNINGKQNLSAYYYFNDSFNAQPFTHFQAFTPNLLPGFGNNSATRSQQMNITDNWTISATMVNEARVTYFREAQGTFLHPQHTNLVTNSCDPAVAAFCFTGTTDTPSVITPNSKLGITPNLGPNHEGVPFINISGGFSIGNDFEGEIPQIGNTYQASDNLTKVIGNHTMKLGVDFRNQRFFQTLFFDPNGQYTYAGGGPNDPVAIRNSDGTQNLLANYLLGLPDSYLQGSTQSEDVRGNSLYLFAQDSWKIRPNLTLNYGLRWEYNQPLYDAGGRYQTYRPGKATTTFPCQLSSASQATLGYPDTNCNPGGSGQAVFPLGLVVPGDKGVPKGLTATYYHAFAPRIGIAWDPRHDGKTTIRAGFGVFYNPIEQLVLEQFQGEPPFGGSSLLSETFFTTPFVSQSCTVPCGIGQAGTSPNVFNGVITPASGTPVDWSVYRPILLFGELQPNLRAQYTNQYNFGIERQLAKDIVLSVGYVGSQGHRLLATRDLNFGNARTCLDLAALFNSGNPAYTVAGNGWADTSCKPFSADNSYGFVLQPGDSLHLPNGRLVTGAPATGTPIGLVGLRPNSSPSCDPVNSWDPAAVKFTNGCPSDGVPVFGSIFAQDTIANSAYHSLQASLEKRFTHGLQFQISYTFSKSLDDASSFENALRPICGGVVGKLSCNRSLSLFDARHRLVLSYLWNLPLPKYEGAKGKLLDGWALSGITSFQSGFPVRINSSADQELENSIDFEPPGKPDLIAPFQVQDPRTHGGLYFNPASFQLAPLGSLGNAPRTICCGPGINNFDFSLQKMTPVGEGKGFEFRAEFFNAFNKTQFLNPDGNISDGSDFGRVKHTRDPRQIQFALKYLF